MKKTDNYNYNMPDREDRVKVEDLNQNAKNVDTDLSKLQAELDTKAPVHSPTFSGEPKAPKIGTPKDEPEVYERILTEGSLIDALTVEVL